MLYTYDKYILYVLLTYFKQPLSVYVNNQYSNFQNIPLLAFYTLMTDEGVHYCKNL